MPTYGVYGQKLDARGARRWSAEGTVVEPLSTTELTQVRQVRTGDAATALWVETVSFNNQLIHAERLNTMGDPQWKPDTVGCLDRGVEHVQTRRRLDTGRWDPERVERRTQ